MKKIFFLAASLLGVQQAYTQISGNINYERTTVFPDNNISIAAPQNANITLNIKGMANVKPDALVAIFSVLQVGKTTQEVNELIDKRINQAIQEIALKKDAETYVDMISFVPVYETVVEKKIFSKKTYNEVPAGFELKKNIHIKFLRPAQLNEFMKILSAYEIYDLVRVDYTLNQMDQIKKELMSKAKTAMQEKIKSHESLLGESFTTVEKNITDGYKVFLPTEMYKSYTAYNNTALMETGNNKVNTASKASALYYQPVIDKEFDFVINPTVLEPSVQVLYQVQITINREKTKPVKATKDYFIITPGGELKNLPITP
ncbi:SIMPL domain-containing protein [Taibaiella sp. KBW10]|uniref:SIMPL domain-containing protein n=1 Tax=Taibaiella sp. KBW10 TaxID=2153357 RepID=UPI000F5B823B|nr:SIMPL domain-containing protein [Taibaiella sp. KBW10]RQO31571.1 SIMPL domain-containing protein [Taibaiella sp. KBW10]